MMNTEPKIDDVDRASGKFKYTSYQEYQDDLRQWDRAEAMREYQKARANNPRTPRIAEIRNMIRVMLIWCCWIVIGALALSWLSWQVVEGLGYSFKAEMITADSETYLACDGAHITSDGTSGGDQVYKITFSDSQTGETTLRGIHKLTIVDAPRGTCTTKFKQ